jgi:hypothetical protein
MDEGVLLPWWSDPQHLNAFFRPLSSLSHVLDFRLWPDSPALMHLHSLGWYALLLLVLAWVYRALEPESALTAGLAFVLFALDDAHGATVGWVANRNALIAATLALPALVLHARAVTKGSPKAALWSVSCFGLGLSAGETAVGVLGYLVAYALCLDPRSWWRRARSLVPFLLVLLLHRALYRGLGLGSFGSSGYHDPLREPVAFVTTLAYNLPVLLSAELFLPLADFAFLGERAAREALLPLSLFGLTLFALVAYRPLQSDPRARFWAIGLCLSAVPVSASLPGERLLLVLGVGACPLLARVVMRLLSVTRGPDFWRTAPLAGMFALVHLVLAPLLLPARAYGMAPLAAAAARYDSALPVEPAVRGKTVIVVNAPVTIMLSYLQVSRAARGVPRPAHLYVLASSSSALRVTRSGARSLRVSLEQGFMYRPEESHYRADADALAREGSVELVAMRAKLLELTPDGRPKTVEFSFDESLENGRYLLRAYRGGRLVPWQPPPLGRTEQFPPEEFFNLVAAEMRR